MKKKELACIYAFLLYNADDNFLPEKYIFFTTLLIVMTELKREAKTFLYMRDVDYTSFDPGGGSCGYSEENPGFLERVRTETNPAGILSENGGYYDKVNNVIYRS